MTAELYNIADFARVFGDGTADTTSGDSSCPGQCMECTCTTHDECEIDAEMEIVSRIRGEEGQ